MQVECEWSASGVRVECSGVLSHVLEQAAGAAAAQQEAAAAVAAQPGVMAPAQVHGHEHPPHAFKNKGRLCPIFKNDTHELECSGV